MNRIKTAERHKQTITSLGKRKFDFKDDRIIGQIALAYSIQLNKYFNIEDEIEVDNKGKEYPESLLGEAFNTSNDVVYKTVLSSHYNRRLSEVEFTKLVKLHIDHGLDVLERDLLSNTKGRNAHIDYLLGIIQSSTRLLSSTKKHISTTTQPVNEIHGFEGLLKIDIGKSNDVPLSLRINDENDFDSQHIAIAGMNGSGKTQLVKDILYQLSKQSDGNLKYIFFDYKGEGKSEKLENFLSATNANFLDIGSAPMPFNPLSAIKSANEREMAMDIMAFRDRFCSVDNKLGTKQKNSLAEVIQRAFDKGKQSGTVPTLRDVMEELDILYEEMRKPQDSLYAILKDISAIVFAQDYDKDFSFLNQSLYVNLPATLPEAARKASVFMILNYLFSYFIASNDVIPSNDRIKPIRYVIVIDEAHAFLNQRNMAKVLEDLLRMIRSKGVIVIMLSQGIEEYKQRDFDFSSQIKIPILLNVQNKDLRSVKSFLGTPKSDKKMDDCLKSLSSGKGVINFTEPLLIDINQFWKREST